jgi:hypothetical protein
LDQPIEFHRYVALGSGERRRFVTEDCGHRLRRSFTSERRVSGQRFVKSTKEA